MTGTVECRYYGRDFTAQEMALLRALIAGPAPLNRHTLSKEFCRRIDWLKPDGGLKDMMARVTMLAMHRDGLIALPAPQGRQNRPGPIVFGPDTEAPLFTAPTTLDEVRPLDLRPVVRGTREGKLWNEFVARYHYLGYKTLVGAQMRYAVHDRNGWPLAMLGFSTAAWTLAPRDTFIGWTPQLREKNLPLVVDNPRFLILPWIEISNLGSHILALVRRRLPDDWTERYSTVPAPEQVATARDRQRALLDQGPERVDDRLRVGVGICLGSRRLPGKPRGERLLADLFAHGLAQCIELAALSLRQGGLIDPGCVCHGLASPVRLAWPGRRLGAL